MTNKTIAGLAAATVPVAGTELLAVWDTAVSQTKYVSIADLVSNSVFAGKFTTLGLTGTITRTVSAATDSSILNVSGSTTGSVYFNVANAAGQLVWGIEKNGGNYHITGSTGNEPFFYSTNKPILWSANQGDNIQVRLDIDGAVTLGTTKGTGQYAFAAGTIKAATGAAVGGATPGAGGIAFPATAVAVADPNTLDDYEEGTWTAAFVPSTSGTITLTLSTGTYVKIGRSVTISGLFTVASVSSPVGYFKITGLPFAGGTGTSFRTSVSIVAANLAATMTTFLTATIQSDSNIYVFKSNGIGSLSGGAEAIQAGSEIFIGGTYQIT